MIYLYLFALISVVSLSGLLEWESTLEQIWHGNDDFCV